MAIESKPLFHPEVIRRHLRAFVLPDSVDQARPRLSHWADLINSGRADTFKETALLPEKNNDIHQNGLDSRALIPRCSAMPTPSFALQ